MKVHIASQSTNGRPPLRIGIIAPCPPPYGGIVRVIENHLAYWNPQEIEVHFVPLHPPDNPVVFEGATFHNLAASDTRSLAGLPEYARCYYRQPLTRPAVYRHFWHYNTALSRLIQDRGLNVIYAHEVWPAGASAVLQSHIHNVGSVVVTYGETWHTTEQYQRQHRVEPYVLRGANRLISTSEHCRQGAVLRGSDPARHAVIYAGVDMQRFRPGLDGNVFREKRGIPHDAFVISSLGMSLRRKLDVLLDALDALADMHNVHVLIGGAGPDADYVKERTAAMRGISVQLLGFVGEEDLPEFYAASNVLVVSPNTLLECMGQSMKEAMACGTAVIGANIGGIPEAIQDGKTGLLYQSDSPSDLARTLKSLTGNSELCMRLGTDARQFAEKKFDARDAASRTLEIFSEAVADVKALD